MSSPLTTELPQSFDPAIFLHSEIDNPSLPLIPPSHSHSDDLEALQQQQEEVVAAKTEQGIVIQHRAWKLNEAFRSEEDYQFESPLRKRIKLSPPATIQEARHTTASPPSSPPVLTMAPISSPMAYPPSSSPPMVFKKKERTKVLNVGSGNRSRTFGGFVVDDDDEDDDSALKAMKQAQYENLNDKENSESSVQEHVEARPKYLRVETQYSDSRNQNGAFAAEISRHPGDAAIEVATQTLSTPSSSSQKIGEGGYLRKAVSIKTCSGKAFDIKTRTTTASTSYEQLVAARSITAAGRAKKSYYGIDIHQLLDDNVTEAQREREEAKKKAAELPRPSIESLPQKSVSAAKNSRTLMWTEKYRARKFTDLVGDERTHRSVLRWLKGWDPIVFPRAVKPKPLRSKFKQDQSEERPHRKLLLLTGPPGLGKTTLAHVCARQAGYEIVEINASDERSRDVVKGRIRDSVGTENVKGVDTKTVNGKIRRKGRPVCVIVDEVDGVVGGSAGGGEGGFIKALLDLVVLDQKNTNLLGPASQNSTNTKKKKGDNFRLLRPLILICNDVYHPSLRPLRQSSMAEIIHIRKPPLNMVVSRMTTVFEKEGVPCDGDGVRRLCEATWGVSNRKEPGSTASGTGEGDIRGIMVVGEWVANKLRASALSSLQGTTRLTRKWIEEHVLGDLAHGGGGARSLGRGGAKEVVERVFKEGAGFPKPANAGMPDFQHLDTGDKIGVAEMGKRRAMDWLRDMVDTTGETDRVVTDCFAAYPSQPFQDDTSLSKPNSAYEFLHFHDLCATKVFSGQEWELNPYLAQSVLAFHHLFASPVRHHAMYSSTTKPYNDPNNDNEVDTEEPIPFSGPRADFEAFETQKQNRALLLSLQSSLSIPLLRMFRSAEEIATDLLPCLITMLNPDVKPVIVGGSGDVRGTASVRKEGEKELIRRAVSVMGAVGVGFERNKVEVEKGGYGGWVYRMEPPLDTLSSYPTATLQPGSSPSAPTRYAVRQVLDQEFQKDVLRRAAEARKARYTAGGAGAGALDEDNLHPSTLNRTNSLLPSKHQYKTTKATSGAKRDFFGRVLNKEASRVEDEVIDGESVEGQNRKKRKSGGGGGGGSGKDGALGENLVWVSFHEGFSNAVRKPIGIEELLRGL
ncbi:MAG: hypothetical protein M1812_007092 [Candelaria pacifica]|nr:MAG: hypothetical protein M1812_007092 [Candelaria pacifica]